MPYDFKSDMWSLGCILYEMMSLKHAFDAADMTSLVMKILRGEHLPIPQQFSNELKDLVRQLLNKNPKLRPTCDQILKLPFLKVRRRFGGADVKLVGMQQMFRADHHARALHDVAVHCPPVMAMKRLWKANLH